MKPETLMQWFSQELLPAVVKTGKFAEDKENQTLDMCTFQAAENYVSSFASVACFAKLKLKTDSGIALRDVLIKFQSQDSVFRERMRTVPQYENEVTHFKEVQPSFVEFLKSCGQQPEFIDRIVPKCYFASNGDGDLEKAVLILEDLRGHGFRLSDSATDLDLQHCLLSVEKLAGFHAISFAMKFKGWKDFEKLRNSFRDVWLEDEPVCREQCKDYLGYVSNRGIDFLLAEQNSEVPNEYLEKLRHMTEPIFELQKTLLTPTEPLSVICHGDFNRNNILYRYVDGEVVDARLIDYQRIMYGSPSIDLGFFIYMNTTLTFREKHFDRVFEHYHQVLVRDISMMINESEKSVADRIPIRSLLEDFGRIAIFHYITVSFFLPLMMTPPDTDFEWSLKNKTFREMAEENIQKGGDVVSRRIAEVIVDFYRRGFYM